MAEERLIHAVSDNPVIYDLTLKGYHDQNIKYKAWRDVSAVLGVSVKRRQQAHQHIPQRTLHAPQHASQRTRQQTPLLPLLQGPLRRFRRPRIVLRHHTKERAHSPSHFIKKVFCLSWRDRLMKMNIF
ncbi:hypothetical protein SKAU_G00174180 [Synaphobranchus kaupii]|uniref:MADF domain-containing protein n=1 Tax=Synaphobranchus kaupii TaxID=118154 RepID=A0A9Q1FKX4_SYNKA|nr:hypothetical protein SKAU_G00174180 [Synaphobranchus kaupii]